MSTSAEILELGAVLLAAAAGGLDRWLRGDPPKAVLARTSVLALVLVGLGPAGPRRAVRQGEEVLAAARFVLAEGVSGPTTAAMGMAAGVGGQNQLLTSQAEGEATNEAEAVWRRLKAVFLSADKRARKPSILSGFRSSIEEKLPDITEFARTYLGVEPYTEPVPVFPTAHYAMGGIPTNIKAEVLSDNKTVVPGLYAAGECACVSVHGANRLGTNSLLDINVFGRRAGIYAVEYAKTAKQVPVPASAADETIALIDKVRKSKGKEKVAVLRKELQDTMDKNAQVYRTEESLNEALAKIAELRGRYEHISVQDKGQRFNTDLLEAIELGFLLDLAEVLAYTALERRESRGGHFREDYPERNDKKFMLHSMAYLSDKPAKKPGDNIKVDWKPVTVTNYQPMERKY